MSTIICLDLGGKRIGMAIGSLESRLAAALGTFVHKSRKADIEKVRQVIRENSITGIVIGISRKEDGEPNSMGRHALSFGGDLESAAGIPVTYWDEALTTDDARKLILDSGASMKNRRGHQDSTAAALILQSYFDALQPES